MSKECNLKLAHFKYPVRFSAWTWYMNSIFKFKSHVLPNKIIRFLRFLSQYIIPHQGYSKFCKTSFYASFYLFLKSIIWNKFITGEIIESKELFRIRGWSPLDGKLWYASSEPLGFAAPLAFVAVKQSGVLNFKFKVESFKDRCVL